MRCLVVLCCTGLLLAQTTPKPKPEDYESQGDSKKAAIGAEYMVHSFSEGEQMFLAEDYLVVEVALYPNTPPLDVVGRQFTLRINGKQLLTPDSPQSAAARLTHAGWKPYRGVEMSGGMGNTGVTLGGPRPTTIPGQTPPGTTPPRAPRAPDADPGAAIEREAKLPADQILIRTALPDGLTSKPVSGFLYFLYEGKTKSIKTLDLLYDGAVVKLK